MAWPPLVLADRSYSAPLNEDLIDALYNRDENLRERPFYLPHTHEHQETTESYVVHETWVIYIPEAMGGSGSEVGQGYMAFQMKNDNSSTAEAQFKIGALTSSEVSTGDVNFSTAPVFWCIFADLSSVAGTEVVMTMELKRTGSTGGSPKAKAREADGPCSYFVGA